MNVKLCDKDGRYFLVGASLSINDIKVEERRNIVPTFTTVKSIFRLRGKKRLRIEALRKIYYIHKYDRPVTTMNMKLTIVK